MARRPSSTETSTHSEGEPKPPTPFLFIPYGATDNGIRPLSSSIPGWACPSILINGAAYTGGGLSTGTPLNLSIVVRNSGGLAATVVGRIYYADPTLAFTSLSVNLIGQTIFALAAGATNASPAVVWIPTSSIPNHVCLLAEATSSVDPSAGGFDAVNDRHYGQLNVSVLTVKPGQRNSFQFFLGNPSPKTARFNVNAQQVSPAARRYLEAMYNAEVATLGRKDIALRMVMPTLRRSEHQDLTVELGPHERRLCQLVMNVRDLRAEQFLAIEVEQLAVSGGGRRRRKPRRVGTLGLVAFVRR